MASKMLATQTLRLAPMLTIRSSRNLMRTGRGSLIQGVRLKSSSAAAVGSSTSPLEHKQQRDQTGVRNDRPEDSITEADAESKKPLVNDPFVKNLFLGKFDTKRLIFPEISDNEELQELDQLIQPVERFFEQLDSKDIDRQGKIPDEVMNQLKELGLFGQQIPAEYGGLELSATKYARLAEVTSLDGSIATMLAAHQAIGLKGILLAGTEAQKEKYLPKLATGENVAAFCLTEPGSGSDASSIKTRGTLSEDGKHYLLNGEKIWITNGGIANIFTVFAKTEVTDEQGEKIDKITAFIVERDFGGITSGKPEDKLGIRGSNTTTLHFDNTPVPVENIIGEVGTGFKLAMNILNSGRFSMGSSVAGFLKKVMGMAADHAITRSQFAKKLMDFDLIKEKFAKMAVTVYAMESMAYLTAGVIDGYRRPDASVEAAIVKVFSSENGWVQVSEALQIMGGLGFMRDYPYERYLRDARILMIYEGTNEILRMFIALNGVQHAGKTLQDLVRKLRDPFNNVGLITRTFFDRINMNKANPKLTLSLCDHVHPNFASPANDLERCVIKFKFAVQETLSKHGNKVIDRQMDLKRLADICIDLYAMTAVLGRASRSICIGLRNHDHEAKLAYSFCMEAKKRIDHNLEELKIGYPYSTDQNYTEIADTIFKNKGYAAEHPLTKTW